MSLNEKPTELKMQRTELEAANEEETSKFSFQKQQLKDSCKQSKLNIEEQSVSGEQLEGLRREDGDGMEDQQKKEQGRKIILLKLERDKIEIEDRIMQEEQARDCADSMIRQDEEKELLLIKELASKGERHILLRQELEEAQASDDRRAVAGVEMPRIEALQGSGMLRFTVSN